MAFLCPAPQAPDPVATANAQGAVNKDALVTAAQLNQINQTGPLGNISYSGGIGSPDRTQTTTLSPELQRLLSGQSNVSNSLTDLANTRLAGAPQDAFSLPNNPTQYISGNAGYKTSTPTFTGASGGPIATSFDSGGQVQRGVNTNFAGQAKQAQDANYASQTQYLDPQFAQSDQALQSRLSAQGITQGSDAYNEAMNNAALQKQSAYSNARNQAIGAGNAEQNTLFGQSLGAGQFSNSALAQQFGQNQGQAQFQNDAQKQQFDQSSQNNNDAFNQSLAANQFSNNAMGQQFQDQLSQGNFNQNLYQQNLGNDITGRNQNINEAMSYVNGSPISPNLPSYQPIPTSTAAQAAPDVGGLAASNYNAASGARAAIMGSIFGAAGKIGGAAVACWVAREVYGQENPEWLAFREWLLTYAPKWFKRVYLKYGSRFAEWIADKPTLKGVIRHWMTAQINACP